MSFFNSSVDFCDSSNASFVASRLRAVFMNPKTGKRQERSRVAGTFAEAVSMSEEKLIVFVKAPRPGTVKTRLAKSIGTNAACGAYCLLVETLLRRIERLENVELRFTPDDAADEIRSWLRKTWQTSPQGAGHLGERLQRAFQTAFQNGANRVVVIGSDCPEITADDIDMAWSALKMNDSVLGPARDGGYWLIGLRQPQPAHQKKYGF